MKKIFCIALSMICVLACHSQIFYKISGNGLQKPSYIFGTHHLAPVSIIDSIPGLRDAIESNVEQIVGEVDMVNQNMMEIAGKMAPYMSSPADSLMSSLIPDEKLPEVNRRLGEIMGAPGMVTIQVFDQSRLKPNFVYNTIILTLASKEMPEFDPQNQLDSYIQQQGAKSGKTIIPLETVEHQAQLLFNSTSISRQLDDLLETLENPDEMIKEIKELNSAYKAHDVDKMIDITKASEAKNPDYFDQLVSKRNAEWMTKIPAIITAKPTLIAVGAGHLPGANGLVELLRKAGFDVEAID